MPSYIQHVIAESILKLNQVILSICVVYQCNFDIAVRTDCKSASGNMQAFS